jgi:hypothetical protein
LTTTPSPSSSPGDTAKPKNGLGDYRTIGRVSLHTEQEIVAIGHRSGDDDRDDDRDDE